MIYNRIAIYRIEPHVIRNWSHQTTCAGELNVKKQAKFQTTFLRFGRFWSILRVTY